MTSPLTRAERIAALHAAARERILVLDGSWGVMIQRRDLTEEDFRGERFRDHNHPQKGNNDLLILTRPDIVADLHDVYYAAGADISETNTFSSTTIAQADYGLEDAVYDLNYEGARIAREVADRWTQKEPHKPRFVAGAIGPTNRTLSLSPDVNDPGYRAVTYDEVYEAYKQQARALHHGGVDIFLIETVFDTLNCKACDQGDQGSGGRRAGAPAPVDLRDHHRPLGPHPQRPDGGGLLELDPPRQAVRRRLQLRPGRRADAAAHR
jgi:5-methyltetrahydrofolate--homocysteine methyltransferase